MSNSDSESEPELVTWTDAKASVRQQELSRREAVASMRTQLKRRRRDKDLLLKSRAAERRALLSQLLPQVVPGRAPQVQPIVHNTVTIKPDPLPETRPDIVSLKDRSFFPTCPENLKDFKDSCLYANVARLSGLQADARRRNGKVRCFLNAESAKIKKFSVLYRKPKLL